MKTVIIAPHADDEIIGCFEVLVRVKALVLFPTETEYMDAQGSSELLGFERGILTGQGLFKLKDSPGTSIFFPDPTTELHPLHKRFGYAGVTLLQQGCNVFFYSTNMNAPYLREVKTPEKKKEMLDTAYPKKRALWEFEHKYFLFEGHTKWIQSWAD